MWYRLAIDATILAHMAFILFVISGALLVRRWPLMKWPHWAALAYALPLQIFNWYCPLTLLEWRLRREAGFSRYDRSFMEHYVQEWIYWDVPQWALIAATAGVVAFNVWFYWPGRAASSGAPAQESA